MPESTLKTKLLAGSALICVSTSVGVLYKASQAATGGFKYSTTSAIAMAEMVKLSMSCIFHICDGSHVTPDSNRFSSAFGVVKAQLSVCAVFHILTLSLLYMVNNQLNFYVYKQVDPGTVFLFKSASTIIVAITQRIFIGKEFSLEQWKAMMLQACGMIIVQYDPCRSAGLYALDAYLWMGLSTFITAMTAVRNEFLVKNYKIGLNVQNATLYGGGTCLNLFAFFVLPNPNSTQRDIGFFEGYDNALAIAVVFANAMIGLAITAVYKYADAVVKCFSSDITAVILIIISSLFFGLRSSLTMWCGVFVVTFAVHLYIDAVKPGTLVVAAPVEAPVPTPAPIKAEEDTASNPGENAQMIGKGEDQAKALNLTAPNDNDARTD